MKFDRNYKPELIASKDETRTGLFYVELDKTEGRMIACDGHRLVAVPVETDEHDTTGPLASKPLGEARKLAKMAKDGKAEIACNGAMKLTNGATVPRPVRDGGQGFPSWRQIMPQSTTPVIAFNAKYLKELAEAIGQDDYVVALAFDPEYPRDPIRVYGTGKMIAGRGISVLDGEKDPIAVLMPCGVTKEE